MQMTEKRKMNRIHFVLNIIKNNPRLSKSEIKQLSGLSMEVVLNYIDYLQKEALIKCEISDQKKVGRKAECCVINEEGVHFIGIKFTARSISGVLVNFAGRPLDEYENSFAHNKMTAEELFAEIDECIKSLTRKFPLEKVTAIGIAAPGIVDTEAGVLKKYGDMTTESVPIAKTLEKKYGITTYVSGTAKTKAVSYQLTKEEDEIENFMYVLIGSGCSAALIYKNTLYIGTDNMDGELGHVRVPNADGLCSCGKRGCLETVIGNGYIVERLREKGRTDISDIRDFVAAIERGDGDALEELDKIADALGYILSMSQTLYVPQQIILCGDYVTSDRFSRRLEKKLKEYTLHEVAEKVKLKYIRNERGNNAYDASQLCYYRKYYNMQRS